MNKYFYYDIKDGDKIVVLISGEKLDKLGENYVIAEEIQFQEDSDLLIGEDDKPYYKLREESISYVKQKMQESEKRLGQELTQEKIKNMQKNVVIDRLGKQIASLKIDIMQLKGGDN